MSTQANVSLRFVMSGANSVIGIMDRISGKKRDLERPAEVPIKADDTDAQAKFDRVRGEVADLNKLVAKAKLDADDAAGKAKVLSFQMELRKLNDYVARPTVTDRGLDRAELRALTLLDTLHKIDRTKATFSVSGIISKIPGLGGRNNNLFGGSGVAIKAAESGGSSGLFSGVSGVGAGASAAVIEALTSPAGAIAGLAGLPFLGTALGGAGVGLAGAGLAGLGIAGAIAANKPPKKKGTVPASPEQLAAAQDRLTAAQLREGVAQDKLNLLQSKGGATTLQLAQAHSALASAQASVSSSQASLSKLQASAVPTASKLSKAFGDLRSKATQNWEQISTPFVGALLKMVNAANTTLPKILAPLSVAFKQMAGPVGTFGAAIANSFGSPAVATAIKTVASAFDQFLSAFTPQIPGIANALANGVNGMAQAFTAHPDMIKGMANVLDFLLKIPGYVLASLGSLTRVAYWLVTTFPHDVSIGLDAVRKFFISIGHGIETAWDATWNGVKSVFTTSLGAVTSTAGGFWKTISAPFTSGFNTVLGVFKGIGNSFDNWWKSNGDAIKQIWAETWGTVTAIVSGIWGPVEGLVKIGLGVIVGVFRGTMSLIVLVWQTGWTVISNFFKIAWNGTVGIAKVGWAVISLLFKASIGILVASWKIFWAGLYNVAKVTWTLIQNTVKGIWDIIVGIFTVFINLLTGHWSAALNAMKNTGIQIWNLTKENLQAIWTAIKNIGIAIFDALRAYFIGLWNSVKTFAISSWNATKSAIVSIWNNVVSTGKSIWNDFFGWLRSGWTNVVRSAGSIWNGIKNAVSAPVKWVAHNVLSPLFRGIDDITSFVHLGNPLAGAVNTLSGMASGGKINAGTHETADDVLIRVSRNETVLSAAHSKFLAPLLGHIGVPGYASGGLVNPIGPGLRPERVDMGVDYGGFGPLYALGSGTITETSNAGWPGGTFIDLRLNPPYGSGYFYYAEDIMPAVRVGQSVSAGQLLGHAWGGPSGIEVGWASGTGGETMAAAQGQQNKNGDPGAFATAWGVAASNLIGSLGGPRGIVNGKISGGTAGIGSIIETVQQIFSGLGKFAHTAVDIAGGHLGSAVTDLLGLVAHGAGGAGGMLGKTLLAIPGTVTSDVVKFIVSKVKGFVSQQQSSAGGLGVTATGPLQDYAKKLVEAKWGPAYWPYFADIVRRESGWNVHATNPSSGAYGIPQALPGDKMASAGADWRTNGYTQLRWMVGYLASRWGNPLNADVNEQKNHWYANGTMSALPGWAVVGERGPELVKFGGGERVIPNHQLGGGNVTYVINVSPGPLARPADIGREVVGAIREYEKRSGKGWRS